MNLSQLVDETVRYCLYLDEEIVDNKPPADAIIVDAITTKIAFNPVRITEKREVIREMLNEMDPSFHKQGGGGMSFLNLCNDKHGELWTGFHRTMAMLVALGIAAGMASYCLPREMWSAFPGGMPYVMIDTTV